MSVPERVEKSVLRVRAMRNSNNLLIFYDLSVENIQYAAISQRNVCKSQVKLQSNV